MRDTHACMQAKQRKAKHGKAKHGNNLRLLLYPILAAGIVGGRSCDGARRLEGVMYRRPRHIGLFTYVR